MRELYAAVWRATGRDQLLLILLSLLVGALAALPLKLQQLVINDLVYDGDLVWLAWLCAGFLAAVLASAGLKFVLGLRQAMVGERTVRRIRERLYRNAVARGEAAEPGALVAMLAAEAVGSFAGGAIATPVLQLGTLVSVIGFIVASQPWLGLLALAVVVPQALIVLGLQERINRRVGERVRALRAVSGRIATGELAAAEPHIADGLATIYAVRRRIFTLKLSSKLALSAISAAGKVGILFLGGWLVVRGGTDVGTVVASLSGLIRIEGPWRDLVSFFRVASTVRVQYGLLRPALEGVSGASATEAPGRA